LETVKFWTLSSWTTRCLLVVDVQMIRPPVSAEVIAAVSM